MTQVLDEATSLCPECFAAVPCQYEERDGQVFQTKRCSEHGAFSSLYWHDADHYRWTRTYREPERAQEAAGCCDGAPGRRKCLAVVNVTDNCNLACSYCFASSRPGLADVPFEEVKGLLRTVIDQSGGPTPIQFSGGEPTTRDDLPELLLTAAGLGFEHMEVNSNGIRIAQEEGYAAQLKAAGATTVYLQFDGFGEDVYTATRSRSDLTPIKEAAVAACRAAGLPVILVPTVVAGVNDHQLGDIVRFALANLDVVRGINFQPVSHFGRHKHDTGHLSLPRIHELLAEQTGFLQADDLRQVPCCSPNCSSATMLMAIGDGQGESATAMPLTRFVTEEAYRDVVSAFEAKRFMDLLAGRADGVDAAVEAAACCGIDVPAGLDALMPRTLAVTVTGFMDADTVDVERLGQCCINVPTKEGRLVPFCGYNLTTRDGRYALREQYARDAIQAQQAAAAPGSLPVVS
ncbi:MAG: radical SAM protein [Thermoplasmatota archaeon]